MNNIALIIRREYLERVNKKSFIVTTILVPILMLALMMLPVILAEVTSTETKTVAVVDDSGLILPNLQDDEQVRFVSAWTDQKSMLTNDSIFGLLIIDRNILAHPTDVKLLSPNSASAAVESDIVAQMNKIIETEKLKKYNIENLDQILADVKTDVTLTNIRTTDQGEEGQEQSAMMNSAIGTILNFVLYMFLLIYGALVMNSIIEEKNNRVLEIVVSSVKPFHLMLGKIVGVGLVAFTQIAIWIAVILGVVAFVLPAIVPTAVLASLTGIFNFGDVLGILLLLMVFLIGGYLLYAAIFAAIGASVDNQQDASQLQIIGVMPVIIGLVCAMTVTGDPDSSFATIMSMVPFTSPMVMMARVPFGVAPWEIIASLLILAASIVLLIWIAAKIYRVGIFMYGQKPTIATLIRWIRYK